jgi:hypothetical protein
MNFTLGCYNPLHPCGPQSIYACCLYLEHLLRCTLVHKSEELKRVTCPHATVNYHSPARLKSVKMVLRSLLFDQSWFCEEAALICLQCMALSL